MSLLSRKKIWDEAREAAKQARRDAGRWDEENMMFASPSPNLLPPEVQRIPVALFDAYSGGFPEGWIISYNPGMGTKEFRDPRGRIWIIDPRDPSYLKALDQITVTAAPAEEPPKPLDRFAGLDL